jgi:hypothetical protein
MNKIKFVQCIQWEYFGDSVLNGKRVSEVFPNEFYKNGNLKKNSNLLKVIDRMDEIQEIQVLGDISRLSGGKIITKGE